MPYRDVDALLTRVAQLENHCLRVRARANRLAIYQHQRQRRWALRVTLVVLVAFAIGTFVLVTNTSACGCHSARAQASMDVRTLQIVVARWRFDHGPGGCPTIKRLVEEGDLHPRSKLEDPWGHRYFITCGETEDDIRVESAGPDGRLGTADDVVAPIAATHH